MARDAFNYALDRGSTHLKKYLKPRVKRVRKLEGLGSKRNSRLIGSLKNFGSSLYDLFK
jgi:hypothetical protein